MPGDEWQQAANLRAFLGYQYAHPGKKLNFMGSEFGQGSEWNNDGQLDWWLLKFDKHRGIQSLVRDLNALYRAEPALWRYDYAPNSFYWLDVNDADHSVFAMMRSCVGGEDDEIIAVTNFTPVPYVAYRLGVPKPGRYRMLLNTDDKKYWGSGYQAAPGDLEATTVSWQNQYHSVGLDLPPLSTIFVKRQH